MDEPLLIEIGKRYKFRINGTCKYRGINTVVGVALSTDKTTLLSLVLVNSDTGQKIKNKLVYPLYVSGIVKDIDYSLNAIKITDIVYS